MKPILASALAVGCVSAVALVSAGSTHAAPSSIADRSAAAVSAARSQAVAHAGVGAGQSLVARDTVLDKSGASHVRFERLYKGLEVVGGDFVVHQGKDATFSKVTGRTMKAFSLENEPTVPAPKAATRAAAAVGFAKTQAKPELVVLAADRAPTLAWRVDVTGRNADGSPAGEYVFVDATRGTVLDRWASVLEDTGSGTGLYVGTVPARHHPLGRHLPHGRPGPRRQRDPQRPVLQQRADLHRRRQRLGHGQQHQRADRRRRRPLRHREDLGLLLPTFGRNGIANDGKGARSYVHDGAYVNASWSDSCFCMRYGDGDGTTYLPLVELDVAGHEMSHGVTSRTAGLTYRGESGGLNESTSDIFGTNVEFFAGNAGDPGDYVIGEEIFKNYNPATNFIRRMDKPSLDGASQDCYNSRTKSVDVHYSSGVGNHFFYLLSEGSGAKTIGGVAHNSPTCNGSTITGIGRAKAAAIWYRALTVYMTSSTKYAGARTATVSAATDLYGATSTEVATVKAAWSAVAVN